MKKIDMTKVEAEAKKFNNDLLEVTKALKAVQSKKCRLKKMSGHKDFNKLMTETLQYEELLKEVRQLLDPKEKAVTMYTQEDVDMLDYDETIKAIRSIQSKKSLSRWLTAEEGNNDEYKSACKIEDMLIKRRNEIRPVDDCYVRKTDLLTVIDTIKMTKDISAETVIELLENLM